MRAKSPSPSSHDDGDDDVGFLMAAVLTARDANVRRSSLPILPCHMPCTFCLEREKISLIMAKEDHATVLWESKFIAVAKVRKHG